MLKQLILLGLAAFLFAGCGEARNVAEASDGNTDKLHVYTSFYPMADFASKVGGDMVLVTNMIPAGGEPHDWEPTPADMASLSKADVFIYNGVGLEHWVETVLNSLNSEELLIVCASEGVELIGGGHGHDEDEDGFDPHVWLSVSNAKKEMENVKNAFVKADPANAGYYEANYERFAKEFDELDKAYIDELAALPNKTMVVSHEAFGYLCNDYGLSQVAVEGIVPHSEPDPATMAEIIAFIEKNNVKTVFFEEFGSSKAAEVIAKESGVEVAALSIVEGLTDEQVAAGEDYLSVMRRNLDVLVKALA